MTEEKHGLGTGYIWNTRGIHEKPDDDDISALILALREQPPHV